jgi:hypothetical protein
MFIKKYVGLTLKTLYFGCISTWKQYFHHIHATYAPDSFKHFMDPEGSLQCSQELATCPYPEPDQSNPHHSILSLQDPS